MSRFITDDPDYEKIKEQINKQQSNKRARSPSPVRGYNLTNLTEEDLENVLGAYIPRRQSLPDLAKSMFGMKTNPKYNQRDVQIARIMAQSKLDKDIEKKEQHYLDELLRTAQYENKKTAEDDARVAAIARKNEMISRSSHAAAQQLRKEQLQNPITDQNLRDAQRDYQELRVDANRSATTNNFVPAGRTYLEYSLKRDEAQQKLEASKARLAEQKRRAYEQSVNQFSNQIEERKRRKLFGLPTGGKSKRVKSKRNKRSTKRRNARK